MPFMQRYVYHGSYYLVETGQCTTLVPSDVMHINPQPADFSDYVDLPSDEDPSDWKIEHRTGWYGRYSANGYMDCTDWHWADSKAELIAELDDMYGDDEETSDVDTPEGWDEIEPCGD